MMDGCIVLLVFGVLVTAVLDLPELAFTCLLIMVALIAASAWQ